MALYTSALSIPTLKSAFSKGIDRLLAYLDISYSIDHTNRSVLLLHEKLSLTGAEISLNELPAGANVPFVHSHKENEEIYGILSGNGKAIIDGEEISLSTGDWLKIAPAAKRQFFASDISGITYICIQAK